MYTSHILSRVQCCAAYYQRVLERIFRYLALVIDLAALFFLNFNSYVYSETLYDSFVSPFYRTHQDSIQKYTEQLEKFFQKNSEQLKSKVASTAGDSICVFIKKSKILWGKY